MYQKQTKQFQNTAQLMIVTAFIIALTFLLLSTLLNLVIYAENKAARGISVAEQSGFESQTQTNQTLRLLLEETNRGITGVTYDPLYNSFTNGTDEIQTIHKLSGAREQHLIRTEITNINNGTRLIHNNSSRSFTSDSGLEDWTVVDSTSGIRNMTQTVNRDSLYTHSNSSQTVDPSLLAIKPGFETQIVDSSGTWRVYIMGKSYTNEILVHTVTPSGNTYDTCTVTATKATIDYTDKTINGKDCPALYFLQNRTYPIDIQYRNGQNANGTYHLHVDKNIGSLSGNFNNPGNGNPYKVASIYSVTYEHSFVSSRLDYQTRFRITPEDIIYD